MFQLLKPEKKFGDTRCTPTFALVLKKYTYQERQRVMARRSLDNLFSYKRDKVPIPSRQWRER